MAGKEATDEAEQRQHSFSRNQTFPFLLTFLKALFKKGNKPFIAFCSFTTESDIYWMNRTCSTELKTQHHWCCCFSRLLISSYWLQIPVVPSPAALQVSLLHPLGMIGFSGTRRRYVRGFHYQGPGSFNSHMFPSVISVCWSSSSAFRHPYPIPSQSDTSETIASVKRAVTFSFKLKTYHLQGMEGLGSPC